MPASTILKLDHFNFSYGKKNIFEDLNLGFEQGMVHGILGPNGAGKSTLFNCIFNHTKFDPIKPTEGYEKEIAYLQTDPYFYPYMTGMEYLKIINRHTEKADAEKWNEVFQLPLDEYIHNYSTGMKRKVALLGNILLNKKIMLLDEPTNGLDLEANEFFKLLIARLKQRGTTIFIAAHILDVLFNTCDTITLLKSGNTTKTYRKEEFEELSSVIQTRYGDKMKSALDELLP